jgi:hypothetical protein
MALQTTGAISLNDIHQEAGGTSGTTASVDDTDIRSLNEASGKTINNTAGTQVSFSDFYGASGIVVEISDGSFSDLALDSTASVFIRLNSDGTISKDDGNLANYTDTEWVSPTSTGIGSSYEVRATMTSGVTPVGTFNSWIALSTNRTWSLSRSSLGTTNSAFTLEIRDTATDTVQDSAAITFAVEVDTLGGP